MQTLNIDRKGLIDLIPRISHLKPDVTNGWNSFVLDFGTDTQQRLIDFRYTSGNPEINKIPETGEIQVFCDSTLEYKTYEVTI